MPSAGRLSARLPQGLCSFRLPGHSCSNSTRNGQGHTTTSKFGPLYAMLASSLESRSFNNLFCLTQHNAQPCSPQQQQATYSSTATQRLGRRRESEGDREGAVAHRQAKQASTMATKELTPCKLAKPKRSFMARLRLLTVGLTYLLLQAGASPPPPPPQSSASGLAPHPATTRRHDSAGSVAAPRTRKPSVPLPSRAAASNDEEAAPPSFFSSIPSSTTTSTTSSDVLQSLRDKSGEAPFLHVVKRDGRKEPVAFDKVTRRLRSLCEGLNTAYVDPGRVAQKVVQGMYNGVSTAELDNLAAETAAYMNVDHPDYARLAARVSVSNLHKETNPSFSQTMQQLYEYVDPVTGHSAGFISDEVISLIHTHGPVLDAAIQHDRDYFFDYFGFKTMERSYLLKLGKKVVERPQYMLMRVALGIHGNDLEAALETYELMSNKWFIHASPTLFHAGTRFPQMSSCFLLTMKADSIVGIYDTLKQCAVISKAAGGIGLSVHNIRAHGAYIKGTKGTSNGLVPMLRVFDVTARYVDQGGGKRPGAFAIYIEPWHADIFEVLDLRKNHGKEEARARDLFYGLWIPDLFMKRVEEDGVWSLMCPDQCPGLGDCHGKKFEALYLQYEKAGKVKKTVRAQDLWFAILDSQIETGTPYMLYKDACNLKSNQQNLGTIRSSNLCTEIIQYTSPEEVAVCNLASIVLPKFVMPAAECGEGAEGVFDTRMAMSSFAGEEGMECGEGDRLAFNHHALYNVTKVVVRNLNKIIDRNLYPVPEAERSNKKHRPIGMGVQGLADTFIQLRLPFDSPGARKLNKEIFETIYFAACSASMELAREHGPYESYLGCPASEGKLQFDLWGVTPDSGRWDWGALKKEIKKHGLRNSLLLAPMPTASTAQILGYNECIEPYTSNLYSRRVKAGEFIVVNPHLLQDLTARGLWTPAVRNAVVAEGGSVQRVPGLPQELKEIYRTVWEIKQKSLIDMAADRGAYIDQSQSLNAFMAEPDYSRLTSMHFYAWKKGLKTGMYYLRTKPAASAIQFTVDKQPVLKKRRKKGASEGVGGEGRGPMTAASMGEEEEEEVNDEDDYEDGEGGAVGACVDDVCLSCQG